MPKTRPPLAVIAGPTASGKSALGLALAERTGGVIVNADSAQVYRDLPVLSAAPSTEDRARAEHRLYGVVDGSVACSAADWAAMARVEIDAIHAADRLPILIGGTGLYLRTLLDGIAPVPEIHAEVRERVRAAPVESNRDELARLDPDAAARLHAGDTTRIARALEVMLSSGRTLKDWQRQRSGGIGDLVQLRPLVLLPPREWLYRRCDERFGLMMENGAVEEVQRLLARNVPPQMPVMRAIGVREIAAMLRGEFSGEDAVTAGQQATRNYAKRQYTWFAHQPPAEWPRVARALEPDSLLDALAILEAQA
jgi:tRNA dimethylallyltransferase